MKSELQQVVGSFKFLGSCYNKDGGLQDDVKNRVGERLKYSDAMKIMFNVRSVSLSV